MVHRTCSHPTKTPVLPFHVMHKVFPGKLEMRRQSDDPRDRQGTGKDMRSSEVTFLTIFAVLAPLWQLEAVLTLSCIASHRSSLTSTRSPLNVHEHRCESVAHLCARRRTTRAHRCEPGFRRDRYNAVFVIVAGIWPQQIPMVKKLTVSCRSLCFLRKFPVYNTEHMLSESTISHALVPSQDAPNRDFLSPSLLTA